MSLGFWVFRIILEVNKIYKSYNCNSANIQQDLLLKKHMTYVDFGGFNELTFQWGGNYQNKSL